MPNHLATGEDARPGPPRGERLTVRRSEEVGGLGRLGRRGDTIPPERFTHPERLGLRRRGQVLP
jgi:hypothetical protein